MEERMDAMDITAVNSLINRDVNRNAAADTASHLIKSKPAPQPREVSYRHNIEKELQAIKEVLDRVIKNTRYSYTINEKIDQFVVKIIDKDTDNVIKEIPSREIQRMHENIQEAIGLLFDTQI
jgi:flagellar protein FlaG